MKQIGNFKLYSLDEVKDELIGKVGTPERDKHERDVEDALHTYFANSEKRPHIAARPPFLT